MFFVNRRSSSNEPILPSLSDSKEEDAISTTISNSLLFLSSDSMAGEGNGTLFLTKKHLVWLADKDLNKGFGVSYASLNTHSVCPRQDEFPADCLLLSIDSKSSSDSYVQDTSNNGRSSTKNDSSHMSVDDSNSHNGSAAVQSSTISQGPFQYISGIAYVRIVFQTKKILEDMYYTLCRLIDTFEADEAKTHVDDQHVSALLEDIENSLTFVNSQEGAAVDGGQFEDADEANAAEAQPEPSASVTDMMVIDSKTNRNKGSRGK